MYLLDTVVYSEIQRPRPNPRIQRFLDTVPEVLIFTSVIVLGELLQGARNAPDERRACQLRSWIDAEWTERAHDRLLPVSIEVARTWGELSGQAMRRGEPLPIADGLIAATAVVHELIVVTRNERDFLRCGVRVRNPWGES